MTCRHLQFLLLSAAALVCLSGCMATAADIAEAESDLAAGPDVEPTRIALRAGPAVAPDEIDGFCENGAGVYLTANADSAELTLYVVTPAETVTFERPALRLTTQHGEGQTTEINEFDSVTLNAGESWVFSADAEGTLLDVVAELDAQ